MAEAACLPNPVQGRRRTIDLLPDREGGTVADWLAARPGIEIVCRDRGSGYRATKGAPQAMQISDRWHLLENATAAFVEGVKRHMGDLRRSIAGGDVDPDALSAPLMDRDLWAERSQILHQFLILKLRVEQSCQLV